MKINFLNFLLIFCCCTLGCTFQRNLSYMVTGENPISHVVTPKGDTIFKFKDLRSGETVRYTIKEGNLLDTWGDSIFVEKFPEFPNGQRALFEFLRKNVRYPRIALENGAQATVIVGFKISEKGRVDSVYIKDIIKIYDTNSPKKQKKLEATIPAACYDAMKAETVRLIEAMPDWEPATQQHRPVAVKFTMPVRFKLD